MTPWASLLAGLGAVALLFALLSFLVQLFSGLPLLLGELYWSIGNLVVGLVLLGVAFGANLDALRERMSSGEARRAGKYGTSAILGTALGIVLLTLLAFLSTRYHTRWDWTEAASHSLSTQTLKVLEDLERDVQVTALYAAIAAPPARNLLDRYTFASDRMKVEFVDPQAQPGRLGELGVSTDRLQGGLLHVAIGEESVDVDDLSEAALTNAIVKLTRLEQKKVYFLTGHNERPVEGEGSEEGDGYAFAAEALRNENYRVEPLLLAAQADVPEDADVLILAGPTRPLHESERKALERYVGRGGALLVLLDPRARTNIYDLLASWGVEVGEDVVVDQVQGLFGRPATPFAAEYPDHPITADFPDPTRDPTVFHMARSVQVAAPAEAAFDVIVRSSQQSWAERNLDEFFSQGRAEFGGDDRAGPVSLAVAGRISLDGAAGESDEADADSPSEARLLVVGDSDFAGNQLVNEFRNRDFFVNSVNWLLGDVEAISIRPSVARASRLQLTSDQFLQIRYLSLFVLPELIGALGVFAWWWRRRAPGR